MYRSLVTFLVTIASLQVTTAQVNNASQAADRKPEALAEVAQLLGSAGGTAIGGVQDFTASGEITVYAAGREHQGNARVLARGTDQFRLDAYLPMGTRSWAVSNGIGELKESDGKTASIPPHNALTLGSLTFPYLKLLTVASDTKVSVHDSGNVTVDGHQLHTFHVHRDFDSSFGSDNAVNRLFDADYFFDPQTHLVTSIRNQTHPVESMATDVSHEVQFSDYRNVKGIMVPFAVTEYVGGQRVWTLQISSIEFNTGLSDSDFTL